MKLISMYCALAVLATGWLQAEIVRVPESFSSIQEGINAARSGDVVQVAAGVYREQLRLKEQVNVVGAGIDQSIVEGVDFKPVVYGANYARLEGFTITNSGEYPGYGIFCNHTSPTITKVRVAGNKWGLGSYFSSPKINNCVIEDNKVEGIHCIASYPDIVNNIIRRNGDGIYCCFCFSLTIEKNNIRDNKYTGVYVIHSSPTLKDNDMVNNGYQNVLCNVFSIPLIKMNNISGETIYNLELYQNNEFIDAKRNFWGSTDKQKIQDKIWDNRNDGKLGKVEVEPWLGVATSGK
jgi:parallel beta-helix repeat protein